jgi:hypothetical protein
VFQLLTSRHVPAMTRTSTHAQSSTPLKQFLTLSMVSTSCIRLSLYGLVIQAKLKLYPHATQTYDGAEIQLHVFLKCTKRRWAVIFTRWPVRPDKAGKHWAARCVGPRVRRDAKNQTSVSDGNRTPNTRSRSKYLHHFSFFSSF